MRRDDCRAPKAAALPPTPREHRAHPPSSASFRKDPHMAQGSCLGPFRKECRGFQRNSLFTSFHHPRLPPRQSNQAIASCSLKMRTAKPWLHAGDPQGPCENAFRPNSPESMSLRSVSLHGRHNCRTPKIVGGDVLAMFCSRTSLHDSLTCMLWAWSESSSTGLSGISCSLLIPLSCGRIATRFSTGMLPASQMVLIP